MFFDNFLVHGRLQQPGAAGGTVETGQICAVSTKQIWSVSTEHICPVSTEHIFSVGRAELCPVPTIQIVDASDKGSGPKSPKCLQMGPE